LLATPGSRCHFPDLFAFFSEEPSLVAPSVRCGERKRRRIESSGIFESLDQLRNRPAARLCAGEASHDGRPQFYAKRLFLNGLLLGLLGGWFGLESVRHAISANSLGKNLQN
jgi:hypothetical protein